MDRTRVVPSLLAATLAAAAPTACRSPLASEHGIGPTTTFTDARLSATIEELEAGAADRQVVQVAASAAAPVGRQETPVDQMLAARRPELEAIGPQSAALGSTVAGTVPLTGEAPKRVVLSLKEAVESAVRNNLEAETARLQKSITEADIQVALASFDIVAGAGLGFERVDRESVGILLPGGGGTTVIPNVTNQRNWGFDGSLAKTFESGARVSLAAGSDRIDNLNANLYAPDPAWSSAVTLGVVQPLLRGAGSEVALAEVRLAENRDAAAREEVRARLLDLVANAERAYWSLVTARARLVSAEWLVAQGIEVRDVLAKRREFDATLAQFANAVATVEARKSLVIEARRSLSEAGNALKVILNDPSLPVGGEIDVVPADMPSDAPFAADLRQSIVTAIDRAPSVRQALLGIDSASIGVTVADNAMLPQLDLNASLSWFGLDDGFGGTLSEIGEGDFISSAAGIRFSQALGNRAAEATYRAARVRRAQAVLGYERAVQSTVLSVKNALVDCVSFRELVEQNRIFRLAQAENLRALLVDEKTLAALTPEFLQLKFQLQNGLAVAEDAYFASLVGYQNALAALQRAMGTGLEAKGISFTDELAPRSIAKD